MAKAPPFKPVATPKVARTQFPKPVPTKPVKPAKPGKPSKV